VEEFAVAESDRIAIDGLVTRVSAALNESDTKRRSLILAALAELSVRYIQNGFSDADERKKRAIS
jgi:hypothetical protein